MSHGQQEEVERKRCEKVGIEAELISRARWRRNFVDEKLEGDHSGFLQNGDEENVWYRVEELHKTPRGYVPLPIRHQQQPKAWVSARTKASTVWSQQQYKWQGHARGWKQDGRDGDELGSVRVHGWKGSGLCMYWAQVFGLVDGF